MKKKLIIIGSVVAAIVAVIAITLVNLEGLVNRNKDFFLSRAEQAIGRQVAVDKIGVTLRGGIGVRLDNFSVADDPGFSSEPFLTANSLQVNAKFLPLLKKEFEIKRVILREPRIRIIRGESGALNTATLGRAPKAVADGPSTAQATPAAAAPVAVSLINIDNGEISFTDRSQGLDLRLTRIESHVEDFDLAEPISLAIRAAFLSEEQNIELRSTFGPVGQDMDLDALTFDVDLKVDAMDIEALSTALPGIAASMPPNVKIDGPLVFDVGASGNRMAADARINIDASAAAVSLPNTFDKPRGTPLVVHAKAHWSPEIVSIESLDLTFHKLEASATGKVAMTPQHSIDLSITTKPASLAEWASLLPAMSAYKLSGTATASAEVSGSVAETPRIAGKLSLADASATVPQLLKPITGAQADITFTGKSAMVEKASIVIGKTRIDGSASITSFEPLVVDYRAKSPAVALDDLRPPNPKAKKPEVLEQVAAQGRMIATEVPTNRGSFTSSGGSIGNIDFQKLAGDYSIVGNNTEISNLTVRTLDGELAGSGLITMEDDVPTFDFTAKGRDLNVVALFDKLPDGASDVLTGKANMTLNISGSGREWQDIQKTISGTGLTELFNGAVLDFNLFEAVTSRLGNISGGQDIVSNSLKDKYPKLFKDRNMDFNDLKSDFVIQNGKLLVRNVNFNADDFRIGAKGAVGFDKSLNLVCNMVLSQKLTNDLINDFKYATYLTNDRGLIQVDFLLGGKLQATPDVALDKDFVNKVIERAFTQKGSNLLEKGIKDLFDFGKKKAAPADTTSKKK